MAVHTDRMNTGPDVVVTEPSVTAILPAVRSRISWGAIIAGVVVAMILQVAMNMLGLAIGAAALDPGDPGALAPNFGTATVLWMAASIFISLFTGGAVAGYMSGRVGRNEGLWHGLTVWAVTTILALWMLTSAAGSVINGVTNALGQGLGLLGSAAADIVPEVAETAVLQDSLLTSIRDEAGAMSGPSTSATTTDAGATTDNNGANAQQPRAMNASMVLAVGEFLAAEEGSPEAQTARDNLMTMMTDMGVSQEEATATIDRWERDFRAVAAQADERAEQAAEDIANAVATTAGLTFMVIALGGLAAGAGGFLGAPEVRETFMGRREERRETYDATAR
jgi:hypothetical protein